MPPSTFARSGNPDQGGGGFGAVLAKLFGVIGKTASEYQSYRQYGPKFRDKLHADELAQQEAEIAVKQHQAALDYEPIKRQAGEINNAEQRALVAAQLGNILAKAQQGNEGQTVDAPLPPGGPLDTEVPAGTGPLAIGSAPKPFVPPRLSPEQVAASGMSEADLGALGQGIYKELKPQRDTASATLRKELAQAALAEKLRASLEANKGVTYEDPTTHQTVTLPKQGIAAAISASGAAQRQKDKPAGKGPRPRVGEGDPELAGYLARAANDGMLATLGKVPPAALKDTLRNIYASDARPVSAKTREGMATAGDALRLIDTLGTLSSKVNTLEGVDATATGLYRTAKSKINLDNDVALLNSSIKAFTPMMLRAFGRVGTPTEGDEARTKAALPTATDGKQLAQAKLALLHSLFSAKSEAIKQNAMATFTKRYGAYEGSGAADTPGQPVGNANSVTPAPSPSPTPTPGQHGVWLGRQQKGPGRWEYIDKQGNRWIGDASANEVP